MPVIPIFADIYIYIQSELLRCKWCRLSTAKNSTRQRKHLDTCQKYQRSLEERRKRNRADTATSESPSPSKQLIISFLRFTQHDESVADKLAARAIYEANLPFTYFENAAVSSFLRKLNPAYQSPSAFRLANQLLDEVYTEVKTEVDQLLAKEESFGVVFNETSNVLNDRVLNITLTINQGAFYYYNAILPPETASAELIIKVVMDTLDIVSKGKRERINACSTDTCAIMRLVWNLLPKQPGLEHCFIIPCDCYGIQLLIKDILEYEA